MAVEGASVRRLLQLAGTKRVLLLPHSVRTGTDKTHNNDLPLCREIHSRLTLGDDLLFVDRELSSQQLRYTSPVMWADES